MLTSNSCNNNFINNIFERARQTRRRVLLKQDGEKRVRDISLNGYFFQASIPG